MSESLVYLRPRQLIGLSIRGPHVVAFPEAWGRLNNWILRKCLAGEVEVGYGLIYANPANADDVNYWAAIEIPAAISTPEVSELARILLPGGAFLRRRHRGGVATMPTEFARMRDCLSGEGHVSLDPDRPAITVLIDIREVARGSEVRSNLLLPARRAEAIAA